ncbi:hypothetical protein SAMN04488570_3164 [Nocardioides scoriae]|uniref:Oxalate:formate antiporter n=1 Tax=Nocardioides scoriae TaxID=642780 RepID=A0A1H1WJE5_9ACTN|nr:hypothetical protein [Nocardioides scoriae]SDS96731.1 hypothetical protein SAMN04488570_3164 [Nocardioides scoriae]
MSQHDAHDRPTSPLLVTLAWLLVSVPLAYGLWQTLVKAAQLLG